MKRALLIAGGTVGGLGAVLSITPPQLSSHSALGGLSILATASAAPIAQASTAAQTTTTAATPTATTVKKRVTKKRVIKKRKVVVAKARTTTTTATKSTASNTAPASTAPVATTPTPAQSTAPAAAPAPKKVTGTFVGTSVNVNFGNVQVQITVSDGKITDAQALQAPNSGRSGSISQYAIPYLRQQTLAAQSSKIQGVGGASYTSYGWYTSLQSALSKAGLPL